MMYINSPVMKGIVLAGVGCAVAGTAMILQSQGLLSDDDWKTQLTKYGAIVGGCGLIVGGFAKAVGVF